MSDRPDQVIRCLNDLPGDDHDLLDVYIGSLERENADLSAKVDKLNNDIQIMVQKAADNHLEGYREMGQLVADAENALDDVMRKYHALMEEIHNT